MKPGIFELLRNDDLISLKKLIQENPGILLERNSEGVTPLLYALYYRNSEAASFIADNHHSPDAFEATAMGNLVRLKKLLNKDSKLVNRHNDDGFTLLGLACFFNHPECVTFLLESGADPDLAANNAAMVAPVHSAVAAGSLKILEILIEAGADPDARQMLSVTPLHAAAKHGELEMVSMLIKAGADPALISDEQKDALDYAVDGKNEGVIRFLKTLNP